jgi:uroporphyrinogen III methyltransferase/synthase
MPIEDTLPIIRSIQSMEKYDWIIFTSVNGVSCFFKYLSELKLDSRKLSANKICAIGSATGDRLNQFGIKPDLMPENFISSDIVDMLIRAGEVRGKSFLMPRADIAPKALSEALLRAGAKMVDDIAVYRTIEEDVNNLPGLAELLEQKKFDLVTFTSSSTVLNFEKLLSRHGVLGKNTIRCAAIGPVTAQTATESGFSVEIIAETHTIEGLVEAIYSYYKK